MEGRKGIGTINNLVSIVMNGRKDISFDFFASYDEMIPEQKLYELARQQEKLMDALIHHEKKYIEDKIDVLYEKAEALKPELMRRFKESNKDDALPI